jgi:hypothetical protein
MIKVRVNSVKEGGCPLPAVSERFACAILGCGEKGDAPPEPSDPKASGGASPFPFSAPNFGGRMSCGDWRD